MNSDYDDTIKQAQAEVLEFLLGQLPEPARPYAGSPLFWEGYMKAVKEEALLGAEPVLQAMLEYGSAIRGSWSDFDGRTMKLIIEDWVQEIRTPDPARTLEWHRRDLGICTAGGGHWCGYWGYCDDECGCEPCAATRGERNE